MHIGIPTEVKPEEYRVAVTPHGAAELVREGHTVFVQHGAGVGSGFDDDAYEEAGAILAASAREVYDSSELIVKVKEPQPSEFPLLSPHQCLFTYLHLAADAALTHFLLERQVRAFGYETLDVEGRLPLLEPMSEVAGKIAALQGAIALGRYGGGRGVLPGGAVGVERGRFVILGGGVAGKAAAETAAGLGAEVTVCDVDLARLHYLLDVMGANVSTLYSTRTAIAALLPRADVVIGTVLIPGARTPHLVSREMLQAMQARSVLVDVSIDQGGCFESSRPTTHAEPTFVEQGIVHYCVTNIPGAYPRTSTFALTNATLPYIKKLAASGPQQVCFAEPAMNSALNTFDGALHNAAVGCAHGIENFC